MNLETIVISYYTLNVIWYCIAENFCMVQNFEVFVDGSAAMKIRSTRKKLNFNSALCVWASTKSFMVGMILLEHWHEIYRTSSESLHRRKLPTIVLRYVVPLVKLILNTSAFNIN